MDRHDQQADATNTAAAGRPTLLRRRSLGIVPFLGLGLAACGVGGINVPGRVSAGGAAGGVVPAAGGELVANPAKNEWPDPFWKAPSETQEAYRYALAHQDLIQYVPCLFGCVNQGHRSNKDCYVREARPDGSYVLEPMSFG